MQNKCSDFHIHIYIYILLLFQRFVFPAVPLLIMSPSEDLKFVCLNNCFSFKSCKNCSDVTNFRYAFDVNNLRSHIKNCDCMLDTFTEPRQSLFWNFTQLLLMNKSSVFHTLKKTWQTITQLEKMHFIEVNEFKLTQTELF